MGHLNQERKKLQSTKMSTLTYKEMIENVKKNIIRLKAKLGEDASLKDVVDEKIREDVHPSSDVPNVRKNEVTCVLQDSKEGIEYTHLTGRFLYQPSLKY